MLSARAWLMFYTLHREAPRREFFPPVWADVCSVPTPARRSARKFHKHRRVDPLPLLLRRRGRRRVVSYPAEFVFWLRQVCGVQNSCFCYYVMELHREEDSFIEVIRENE